MQKLSLNALLDHGISSTTPATSDICSNNVQLVQPFTVQNPDAFECPDVVKAIFLKSEDDLENAITLNKEELNTAVHGYSLIQFATLLGWARGCEILLENGAEIKGGRFDNTPLLLCAIFSSDVNVLRVWIDLGPDLDDEEVSRVGHLEDTLESAYEAGKARGTFELLDAIISEIVQRRRELQRIAEVNAKR